MQEKQDQKVVLVSLSIHINFEHEEHTQKKKNPDLPTQISQLSSSASKDKSLKLYDGMYHLLIQGKPDLIHF